MDQISTDERQRFRERMHLASPIFKFFAAVLIADLLIELPGLFVENDPAYTLSNIFKEIPLGLILIFGAWKLSSLSEAPAWKRRCKRIIPIAVAWSVLDMMIHYEEGFISQPLLSLTLSTLWSITELCLVITMARLVQYAASAAGSKGVYFLADHVCKFSWFFFVTVTIMMFAFAGIELGLLDEMPYEFFGLLAASMMLILLYYIIIQCVMLLRTAFLCRRIRMETAITAPPPLPQQLDEL